MALVWDFSGLILSLRLILSLAGISSGISSSRASSQASSLVLMLFRFDLVFADFDLSRSDFVPVCLVLKSVSSGKNGFWARFCQLLSTWPSKNPYFIGCFWLRGGLRVNLNWLILGQNAHFWVEKVDNFRP